VTIPGFERYQSAVLPSLVDFTANSFNALDWNTRVKALLSQTFSGWLHEARAGEGRRRSYSCRRYDHDQYTPHIYGSGMIATRSALHREVVSQSLRTSSWDSSRPEVDLESHCGRTVSAAWNAFHSARFELCGGQPLPINIRNQPLWRR